jgi:hypothetical protein
MPIYKMLVSARIEIEVTYDGRDRPSKEEIIEVMKKDGWCMIQSTRPGSPFFIERGERDVEWS